MTENPAAPSKDKWTYGLGAVVVGVGGLLIAFTIVVFKWKTTDGVAALSVIASPIAAMIGAYLGIQISGEAAKNANAAAKDATASARDATASARDATASARDADAKAGKAEGDKTKALTDLAVVMGHLPESKAAELRPTLNSFK